MLRILRWGLDAPFGTTCIRVLHSRVESCRCICWVESSRVMRWEDGFKWRIRWWSLKLIFMILLNNELWIIDEMMIMLLSWFICCMIYYAFNYWIVISPLLLQLPPCGQVQISRTSCWCEWTPHVSRCLIRNGRVLIIGFSLLRISLWFYVEKQLCWF